MKKLFPGLMLLSMLPAIMYSCNKKPSTPAVLPPIKDTVFIDTAAPVDISVTMTGVKDIKTTAWSMFSIPVSVMRNSGEAQKVTLKVDGMPGNVQAKFSAASGYASFSTSLDGDVAFIKPGTYPIKISGSTEKGKVLGYDINLVIDSLTKRECSALLLNNIFNFLTTKNEQDSTIHNGAYITVNSKGELFLRMFVLSHDTDPTKAFTTKDDINDGYNLMLTFNCDDGSLTIPDQIVTGVSASGNNTVLFSITGQGKVDIANGTFEFGYTTRHGSSGTIVVKNYVSSGALR